MVSTGVTTGGQAGHGTSVSPVDIVAHTMTILCSRLEQVDFSSVDFMAHQRVLVLKTHGPRGWRASAGRRYARARHPIRRT